jgi:hypothetical protein
MNRSFARGVALALSAAVLLVAAPSVRAQVSVDDRIASLAEHVKKKSDDQAATVVDGIAQAFPNMSEEDKKKVVAAMEKTLNAKREEKDDKLFETVVNSWANMGEMGEKATLKNLKNANVEKRPSVLATALRSIGTHKNPANEKALTDYLVSSEPQVVSGAADGLANYADRPEKERKPIVDELQKAWSVYGSAAIKPGATPAEKSQAKGKLQTVEKSFQAALQKLTGQEFKDFAAAQKWWNQNKGNKWPEPAAGGAAPPKN